LGPHGRKVRRDEALGRECAELKQANTLSAENSPPSKKKVIDIYPGRKNPS